MKTKVINGNIPDDWDSLPWATWEREIFRLQERIAQAATNGDRRQTHRLQRLMLHSFTAKCIAVRKVARMNRGRHTAGVDGIKSLSRHQCLTLARSLSLRPSSDNIKRVWIDKPGKSEKRPLSIPTMRDRARQMLVVLALEPEWETRFEQNSFGFRPGRSTADAMMAVFSGIVHHPKGKYVLDADIRQCFDRIDHNALLEKLATIAPIRRLIKGWLKAGILDGSQLERGRKGVPQGGVVSPLLCNIALHGLEHHVTHCVPEQKRIDGKYISNKPILVRYADDFLILHTDKDTILECQIAAENFLREIGLELSQAKTTIRHTLEDTGDKPGFNFLGFTFRSFRASARHKRGGETNFKTLVKPSKEAIAKHYNHLCAIIDQCRTLDQLTLIKRLNPVIRGWSNYYCVGNSSKAFNHVDNLLYLKLRQWGHRRHTDKGKAWITNKYWNRGAPWKFMDAATHTCLIKHTEIHTTRHTRIRGASHPFDRDRVYWTSRMRRPTRNARSSVANPSTIAPKTRGTSTVMPECVDLWRYPSGDEL
jgi:RNA-directed DNA polymerase